MAYGRRVVVVAGKGNNGTDGRAAAARLVRRGASVLVLDAASGACLLPAADLVIDAAYGTGLGRALHAARPAGTPVLAVDIPSGLSGLTGEIVPDGDAVTAAITVTFAALKPGLLLGQGPARAGRVELVDIGLGDLVDAAARIWLMEDDDAATLIPPRPREGHKWQCAVQVVAGSPGMTGAPWLVSRAALRTGAGYVRLGMPGVDLATSRLPPRRVVTKALPAGGLGRSRGRRPRPVQGAGHRAGPRPRLGGATILRPGGQVVGAAPVPVVIDADGLNAFGSLDALAAVIARPPPSDGDHSARGGVRPAGRRASGRRPDRRRARRRRRSGAVVLLKGSTTVVAGPDGRVLLAAAGSARLATAGTGDVLSGVIGALLARGVPAVEAAALGAHVHGRAAGLGFSQGLVATDLPELVARWLSSHVG